MNSFTERLYKLVEVRDSHDEDMHDFIMDELDSRLLAKQFNEVDSILSELEMNRLPASVIASILTVTLMFANQLRTRTAFYNDAFKQIQNQHDEKKAISVLNGLEGY